MSNTVLGRQLLYKECTTLDLDALGARLSLGCQLSTGGLNNLMAKRVAVGHQLIPEPSDLVQ